MGNLHKGHTSLIDIAKQFENKIISSIYVNKLQFNDNNDYLNYPKTLDADIELLERHGCDYLLIPDDVILENIQHIQAPLKSTKLCGQNRPGHFDGVLTILNIIKPAPPTIIKIISILIPDVKSTAPPNQLYTPAPKSVAFSKALVSNVTP